MESVPFKSPVLVIVAHWDDETVLLGGTLIKYGAGWTVVSVTQKQHVPGYQEIFNCVCRECNATPVTLSIRQREKKFNSATTSLEEFCSSVKRTEITIPILTRKLGGILGRQYSTVITHHPDGDLGRHLQHKEVAAGVTSLFLGKARVWYIVREPPQICDPVAVLQYCREHSTHVVGLDADVFMKKMQFVRRYKPGYEGLRFLMPEEYFVERVESATP
jgi:hypothetical protein